MGAVDAVAEGDVAVAVVDVVVVKVAVAVVTGAEGVSSDEEKEKYTDDGKTNVFLAKGSWYDGMGFPRDVR